MNNSRPILFITLLLLCTAANAGWPGAEKPPGAVLEPMGGNLKYNGMQMRSWVFRTPLSSDKVLEYYRNRWRDKEADESQFGNWQQISRKHGGYFITVQLQDGPASGTIGRINIMQIRSFDEINRRNGAGIPMPGGSHVVNDIDSDDEQHQVRTVALVNQHSVDSNVQFYLSHYQNSHWGVSEDRKVNDKAHVLIFRKSSQEVTIMINDTGTDTAVMINQTGARTWYH